MTVIVLDVVGLPTPQGSKRAFVDKTGHARMTESSAPRMKEWRQDVKAAVTEHTRGQTDGWEPLDGPVSVTFVFRFARPKHHYRTGKATSHLLRDNVPAFPVSGSTGDVDKLIRSSIDALAIAGMFVNDKQVAHTEAWKTYADGTGARPGARIEIRTLDHLTEAPSGVDEQEVLL